MFGFDFGRLEVEHKRLAGDEFLFAEARGMEPMTTPLQHWSSTATHPRVIAWRRFWPAKAATC